MHRLSAVASPRLAMRLTRRPFLHRHLSHMEEVIDDLHVMKVRMPSIMDSKEGKILKWMKHEGETLRVGDSLCRVDVNDIQIEIESPFNGVLADVILEEYRTGQTAEDICIICDSKSSYMDFFEARRLEGIEKERMRVSEEKAKSEQEEEERKILPSHTILLREIRHMMQSGGLADFEALELKEGRSITIDPSKGTLGEVLINLARKQDANLLDVFYASYDGDAFNVESFDQHFFLAQAVKVAQEDA